MLFQIRKALDPTHAVAVDILSYFRSSAGTEVEKMEEVDGPLADIPSTRARNKTGKSKRLQLK